MKETPLQWHADRALQTVLLIQAVNEFITNGVVAGTIALLVQHLLPATNLALGVATATGALGATRLLLAMATAPLAETLSDRLGKRWPVTLGGLVAGIVNMVLVASRTPMVAFPASCWVRWPVPASGRCSPRSPATWSARRNGGAPSAC